MALTTTPAAERWSQIIDLQEASGLTLRSFAKANGLNGNTLAWWRWELARRRQRRDDPSPRFVELVVAEPEPTSEFGPVEIALDGLAACVLVDEQTDLALVRRVLEALC